MAADHVYIFFNLTICCAYIAGVGVIQTRKYKGHDWSSDKWNVLQRSRTGTSVEMHPRWIVVYTSQFFTSSINVYSELDAFDWSYGATRAYKTCFCEFCSYPRHQFHLLTSICTHIICFIARPFASSIERDCFNLWVGTQVKSGSRNLGKSNM